MMEKDALTFGRPYQEDPAASAAISHIMEKVEFTKLLNKVDDGYRTWRTPSLLLFGANDPFVSVQSVFDFLESKRTTMKMVTASAKV